MKKFSPENQLIVQDIIAAIKNTVIFASPLLIAFLLALQSGKSLQESLQWLYMAAIQFILDLIKKWKNEVTYK